MDGKIPSKREKRQIKLNHYRREISKKVQLIATLIHEPKLVILDEPFSGLDPVNAELLKDGIIELKEKGSCVIFSSHNMDNVEKNLRSFDHAKRWSNGSQRKVHEIRESFGRTKVFLESSLSKRNHPSS